MEGLPWRTVHVEGCCLKTGSWHSARRANPITSSESAGGRKLKDYGKCGRGWRAKTEEIECVKIDVEGHFLPQVMKDFTQIDVSL